MKPLKTQDIHSQDLVLEALGNKVEEDVTPHHAKNEETGCYSLEDCQQLAHDYAETRYPTFSSPESLRATYETCFYALVRRSDQL